MIRAVQDGEAAGTPSMYRAEYEPGTQAPSFDSGDSSADTSFTGVINRSQPAVSPVEVDTGSAPAEPGSAAAFGAVDASYVPISDHPGGNTDSPVLTESTEVAPMPASTTETNSVPSVSMSTPATTGINPDLAARYAVYKDSKQETGSVSAAYAASHRNIGVPTSAPVHAQPAPNGGAGMANVNMGRANNRPPQQPAQVQPPVSSNQAPASSATQGRPTPTPATSHPSAPRSWAPGSRPANPHREVRTATQTDSAPVSEPIQADAPPPPPAASNYDIPIEAIEPRRDDVMTQAELDALSEEILGGDPFDDPFDD